MKNGIPLRGIGLATTGAMRLDASKIEAELGWTPQVTVQEGLRRTVEWYLTHQGWWEPLLERGAPSCRSFPRRFGSWCSPNQRWCAAPCEFRS